MERLRQIAGAIFDLDGTLLDSMGVWGEIDRRFLARRGIPLPPDYTDAVSSLDFPAAARYTIARFALTDTPEMLMREWSGLARDAYAHEIPLKPHAAAYLRTLAARGVKLGVATSSTPDLYIPALRHNGVYDLFDAFTNRDEVARGKGFPDIYCETARRLGLPPSSCAVFEDIALGVKSAKAGGFLSVAVYDRFAALEEAVIRREADIYLESFAELL